LSSNGKLIEVLPDLDERRKVPALTSDLYELALRGFRSGASLTERDVTRFAEASSCLPSALGILYVVEGSSLGGLVLLKALTNLLRTFDNRANSFLRGYGPQTQNKWRYFCGILNAIPFGRNEERVLVDRALEMFELIKFELKEYS
jgi:heme oxygenase